MPSSHLLSSVRRAGLALGSLALLAALAPGAVQACDPEDAAATVPFLQHLPLLGLSTTAATGGHDDRTDLRMAEIQAKIDALRQELKALQKERKSVQKKVRSLRAPKNSQTSRKVRVRKIQDGDHAAALGGIVTDLDDLTAQLKFHGDLSIPSLVAKQLSNDLGEIHVIITEDGEAPQIIRHGNTVPGGVMIHDGTVILDGSKIHEHGAHSGGDKVQVQSHGTIVIESDGKRQVIEFDPQTHAPAVEHLKAILGDHGGDIHQHIETIIGGRGHGDGAQILKRRVAPSAPKRTKRPSGFQFGGRLPAATPAPPAAPGGSCQCTCSCCGGSAKAAPAPRGANTFFFGPGPAAPSGSVQGLQLLPPPIPAPQAAQRLQQFFLEEGQNPGAQGVWRIELRSGECESAPECESEKESEKKAPAVFELFGRLAPVKEATVETVPVRLVPKPTLEWKVSPKKESIFY